MRSRIASTFGTGRKFFIKRYPFVLRNCFSDAVRGREMPVDSFLSTTRAFTNIDILAKLRKPTPPKQAHKIICCHHGKRQAKADQPQVGGKRRRGHMDFLWRENIRLCGSNYRRVAGTHNKNSVFHSLFVCLFIAFKAVKLQSDCFHF
jgi:hypothetical protein